MPYDDRLKAQRKTHGLQHVQQHMRMKTQSKWKMCTIYNTLHVYGEVKRPSMANLPYTTPYLALLTHNMHDWNSASFNTVKKDLVSVRLIQNYSSYS